MRGEEENHLTLFVFDRDHIQKALERGSYHPIGTKWSIGGLLVFGKWRRKTVKKQVLMKSTLTFTHFLDAAKHLYKRVCPSVSP